MTRCPFRRPSAACRRYFLRAYILVFIMPVNIQLSKISIASAISSNEVLPVQTHCRFSLLLVGVVGPDGIEPSTSPLSGVRSSHLSYGPSGIHCRPNTGGAGRDRTGDLLSANQALSQLSYSPFFFRPAPRLARRRLRDLIEASWIQGPRISHPQPLSDSLPYACLLYTSPSPRD